jgi:hypothetical protein
MDYAALAAIVIAVLTFVGVQVQLSRTAHRDDTRDLRDRVNRLVADRNECMGKLAALEGTVKALREENLFLMGKLVEGK